MQGRKLKGANTSGRSLLGGAGPGVRVYNDQGATQGVNVVRPVGECGFLCSGWIWLVERRNVFESWAIYRCDCPMECTEGIA